MSYIETILIPDNRSWKERYFDLEASNSKLVNQVIEGGKALHARIAALEAENARLREAAQNVMNTYDADDELFRMQEIEELRTALGEKL